MGNALSLNVPSRWFMYRKFGVESFATYRSSQPSSLASNQATPRPKYARGSETPAFAPTSANRPSPVF
jgi:hypothetical protein